jgi:putative transposase
MIEPDHPQLSVSAQCRLLCLPRSSFYYAPAPESALNLTLMGLIDAAYTEYPFYGSPRMTAHLRGLGYVVNPKRVARLMRRMGLMAIYPKRNLSQPAPGHRVYRYLLRGVPITRVNQVWSCDITYIRLAHGFAYLAAVIDWYSRYVVAWELSNTLDGDFCVRVLERALLRGTPKIFNTDQGSQFTSDAFTGRIEKAGAQVSMDGRGRALDNIFVERLWRTVKYEDVYLRGYETMREARQGLGRYFDYYNDKRPHQSLAYYKPAQVWRGEAPGAPMRLVRGEDPPPAGDTT